MSQKSVQRQKGLVGGRRKAGRKKSVRCYTAKAEDTPLFKDLDACAGSISRKERSAG